MAKAKEIAGLDCEAGVRASAALILGARLEEMCQLRAAALDWADIEGVHDMRVASRRLRSALKDFMPYLRKNKLRRAQADLKRVADALGAVRDEDVAIMALEELKQESPPEVATGILQIMARRSQQREQARSALVEAISEDALARLQSEFAAALEQATKWPRKRKHADGDGNALAEDVSFRRAARDIVAGSFEELQRLSKSLYEPFKTKRLHRMRIVAKRLRYAIELFEPCWGEQLAPFAEEIAEMQSDLGKLHDCDEWIVTLGARLRSSDARVKRARAAAADNNEEQRAAAICLLDHFVKARTKHYRAALARWHEWEEKSFAANLKASLDTRQPPVDPAPVTMTDSDAVLSEQQSA
jgi:CHAD domain-containing protein